MDDRFRTSVQLMPYLTYEYFSLCDITEKYALS